MSEWQSLAPREWIEKLIDSGLIDIKLAERPVGCYVAAISALFRS